VGDQDCLCLVVVHGKKAYVAVKQHVLEVAGAVIVYDSRELPTNVPSRIR
jgi:hypothetical protein